MVRSGEDDGAIGAPLEEVVDRRDEQASAVYTKQRR